MTIWRSSCIICESAVSLQRMEKSRSWPSAHDWKSCIPQKGIEGSNPSFSAIKKTLRYSKGFLFLLLFRPIPDAGKHHIMKQIAHLAFQMLTWPGLDAYPAMLDTGSSLLPAFPGRRKSSTPFLQGRCRYRRRPVASCKSLRFRKSAPVLHSRW